MISLDSIQKNVNFWEVNPELTIPSEFADLYKKDESKSKAHSSKLMWAIALYIHPKSKFRILSKEESGKVIAEDFLKDPKFKWNTPAMLRLVEEFKKYCITKAQRFLVAWEDKLEERQNFLETVQFTIDDAEDIDKMLSRTDKLWTQYRQCLKDVEDEDAKGQVRGGAAESASEQGLI